MTLYELKFRVFTFTYRYIGSADHLILTFLCGFRYLLCCDTYSLTEIGHELECITKQNHYYRQPAGED